MTSPTLDEVLDVLARASFGDTSARVRVPEDATGERAFIAHALNVLLQDLDAQARDLRASRERLELVLDATGIGLWYHDPSTGRSEWSGRTREHLDVPPDVVPSPQAFYDAVAPEDRAAVMDAVTGALAGGDRYDQVYRTARGGRTLRAIGRVFRDEAGRATRFDGVTLDLTREVRDAEELENARKELSRSEKMSALGTLVSGVAHEVRTPLAYLGNNVTLIERRLARAAARGEVAPDLAAEVQAMAREAVAAVDRVNRLVTDLRRFTKQEPAPRVPVALSRPVAEAAALFRATSSGKVDVVLDLAAAPVVHADGAQVQQVVLNLLQNAAEAMPGGGTIRVTTRAAGPDAELVVADDGPGIPPEVAARMFEPLYSTKPEGTGLGLSIVRRIVQDHGGSVAFESRPGHGTTFVVRWPGEKGTEPVTRASSA